MIEAFGELLQAEVLLAWILGMLFGVFVGSTPGLTATMAVALIVPLSYRTSLGAEASLAMIVGVSFTAIFSGDIPATYLRIPGTPASAAATLDGHELSRRGFGRFALTLDLICSCMGGLIGVLLLITVAPLIARFALKFSNFENFWLAVVGLSLSALVSRGNVLKGMLAALLGVLLATVGRDGETLVTRLTFGSENGEGLAGGLSFIPAMIGVFGVAEVLRNLGSSTKMDRSVARNEHRTTFFQAFRHALRRIRVVVQSALAGTVIGALPGAGADVAAWGAYGLAQKTSRRPRRFGHASIEGVVAPTSANNAAVAGAWIPALVFGIPGDAVTAIVVGAFLTYEITPGPTVFQEGNTIQVVLLIALLTQLLLLPAGLAGIRVFGWFMRLPRGIVLTLVLIFSVVGAYAFENRMFDVYTMLAFGVLGFYLESQRVPVVPLILGMILCPEMEKNLRRGLISSGGDVSELFTRPICAAMIGLLLIAFLSGPAWRLLRRKR